jgi:uncharacterized domain HDIG
MIPFWSILKKYSNYILIALVAILLAVIIPGEGKFRYEYQRGRPWLYETLSAPIDIPILKTPAELRAEREKKSSSVTPYYRSRTGARELQISQLTETAKTALLPNSVIDSVTHILNEIYQRGIIDELPDSTYKSSRYVLLEGASSRELASSTLLNSVNAAKLFNNEVDSRYGKAVRERFNIGALHPNMLFDNNATQIAHREELDRISPTKGVLYSGQLIVSEGEIVTADIEQLLDSYKAEYEYSIGYSGNYWLIKAGQLLIIVFILILFAITAYYLKGDVLRDFNKLSFMLLQFIIVAGAASIVTASNAVLIHIVPFSVIAIYLVSFFDTKIVLPLYTIILMPLILIAQNGFEIYFMNLFAGGILAYTFFYWDKGLSQFGNSLVVFFGLTIIYVSFRIIEDGTIHSVNLSYIVYFIWNSILVIAAYPFLYLFEKVFSLVSKSRLRDLSDATTPILTALAEKAPGTFQHSLQVANLAESVSREIGAFSLLARVGALYHDIGKIENPSAFIENIPAGMESMHKELTPKESAAIILRHIDDGAAMAKKAHLPQIIIDFILSHHGTTQAKYFYNKYINDGGNPADIDKFTYNGVLPIHKEQVIVMIADAVEAASRTLPDYSAESISKLVERMAEDRISERQLADADVTLREITIIKETLKKKLQQIYHARIAYPEK